jgi:hypothetical protein
MGHLKKSVSVVGEKCKILPMLKYVENAQNIQKWYVHVLIRICFRFWCPKGGRYIIQKEFCSGEDIDFDFC